MKAHSLRLLALSSFGLVGGCAAEGPRGPLNIAVAPLTLPGIADVCYGLTVFNGVPATAATVWAQNGICSSQYGNIGGGDITYIGTCDADSGSMNYVQLVLEKIKVDNGKTLDDQLTSSPSAIPAGDGDADFENPCAEAGDCVLSFPCIENEDVFVEFNITVMRDAEQGFFDIAVNFEDIFCSAKFDSCVGDKVPDTFVPPRMMRDVLIDREKYDLAAFRYNESITRSQYYVFAMKGSDSQGSIIVDPNGTTNIWAAARVADFGRELNSQELRYAGIRAESAIPNATIAIADVGTINAATATLATKPNNLLFGEDGERQHTAVAALACTAGSDAEGTELVFNMPTISCQTSVGDRVIFKLDGLDTLAEGDGGNQEISVLVGAEPGTEYTLRYGVYFDTEDLNCGVEVIPASTEHASGIRGYLYSENANPVEYYARYENNAWRLFYTDAVAGEIQAGVQDAQQGSPPPASFGGKFLAVMVDVPGGTAPISCNKAFYNLAFNIGDLADQGLIGCSFDWGASAIETGSDILNSGGFLADDNAVYPGISYSGILLTGKPDTNGVVPTLCSENPLNGEWSSVETGYIKGKAYGEGEARGVDYHTTSTALPKRYSGN